MRGLIAGLFLLGTCISSSAHRAWDDGREVEADVSTACCGLADAHWEYPGDVLETETDWIVPDFPGPDHKIKKDPVICGDFQENSSDFLTHGCKTRMNKHGGLYWFFWTDNPKGNPQTIGNPTVYCIFIPASA